jgi:hypothetical protein
MTTPQYVAICLRYEVEIGNGYPYPMYSWSEKSRLYRFKDAELFSKLATAEENSTWSDPEVEKMLEDLTYGESTDAYEMVSSGKYLNMYAGNNARLLMLSHTVDGVLDESDM